MAEIGSKEYNKYGAMKIEGESVAIEGDADAVHIGLQLQLLA